MKTNSYSLMICLLFGSVILCCGKKSTPSENISPEVGGPQNSTNQPKILFCDSSVSQKSYSDTDIESSTVDQPIKIATAEQLAALARNPLSLNAHMALCNDIDLTKYYADGGAEFMFGRSDFYDSYTNTLGFSGTFDGRHSTVKGFSLQPSVQVVMGQRISVGFFQRLSGGSIKDLRLENMVLKTSLLTTTSFGHSCLSGFIGLATHGTIKNVFVSGSVLGPSTIGAFYLLGGMIGAVESNTNDALEVSHVEFSGAVTGAEAFAGGLIGQMNRNMEATNPDLISIQYGKASGTIQSSNCAGGLVCGIHYGSIAYSSFDGTLKARHTAGGLAAVMGVHGRISNSVSRGLLEITSSDPIGAMGGAIGTLDCGISFPGFTQGLSKTVSAMLIKSPKGWTGGHIGSLNNCNGYTLKQNSFTISTINNYSAMPASKGPYLGFFQNSPSDSSAYYFQTPTLTCGANDCYGEDAGSLGYFDDLNNTPQNTFEFGTDKWKHETGAKFSIPSAGYVP